MEAAARTRNGYQLWAMCGGWVLGVKGFPVGVMREKRMLSSPGDETLC